MIDEKIDAIENCWRKRGRLAPAQVRYLLRVARVAQKYAEKERSYRLAFDGDVEHVQELYRALNGEP